MALTPHMRRVLCAESCAVSCALSAAVSQYIYQYRYQYRYQYNYQYIYQYSLLVQLSHCNADAVAMKRARVTLP